jgi:hypothetical protein
MMLDEVENYILKQARTFSANERAKLEDYVYRDLGIGGSDAVEFYEDIEKNFGVNIKSITETSVEVEATWLRKAYRKSVARDVNLAEIVKFIMTTSRAS